MTDSRPARKFADELVSQDAAVSGYNFEEFRMNLEKSLESIQRRARSVHRASWVAAALAVVCLFAMLPLELYRLLSENAWVRGAWGACLGSALFAAAILSLLYRHRYLRAIERVRSDLQIAMIAELQRQIASLTQRMDDRTQS